MAAPRKTRLSTRNGRATATRQVKAWIPVELYGRLWDHVGMKGSTVQAVLEDAITLYLRTVAKDRKTQTQIKTCTNLSVWQAGF